VQPIRVLLADDHELLREGLVSLLEVQPDIKVVAEASDGESAVDLTLSTRPDVVVMDVTMPHLNGVEATQRISAARPEIRVVGLSMHEQADMAGAMRRAGAVNYLPKDGPAEELIAAIRNAARGPKPGPPGKPNPAHPHAASTPDRRHG
jgi:DNA-binding NarL/FixJ family response regulator